MKTIVNCIPSFPKLGFVCPIPPTKVQSVPQFNIVAQSRCIPSQSRRRVPEIRFPSFWQSHCAVRRLWSAPPTPVLWRFRFGFRFRFQFRFHLRFCFRFPIVAVPGAFESRAERRRPFGKAVTRARAFRVGLRVRGGSFRTAEALGRVAIAAGSTIGTDVFPTLPLHQ